MIWRPTCISLQRTHRAPDKHSDISQQYTPPRFARCTLSESSPPEATEQLHNLATANPPSARRLHNLGTIPPPVPHALQHLETCPPSRVATFAKSGNAKSAKGETFRHAAAGFRRDAEQKRRQGVAGVDEAGARRAPSRRKNVSARAGTAL